MMFKEILDLIGPEVSKENAMRIAAGIYSVEKHSSSKNWHRSASLCAEEMRKAKLEKVEIIPVPADGKSTFMDMIMPPAWDVNAATLEILETENIPYRLLSDYRKNPHSLALWSAPTPARGIETEIVFLESENDFNKDIKGKIAFTSRYDPHNREIKKRLVDKGAAGLISAYSPFPDILNGVHWLNSVSESRGWYPTRDDRPFFCFSISPIDGCYLRSLANKGKIKARAKVDAKIYDGTFDTITGIIPGAKENQKEIIILAHLYEPQAYDDACGGAAVIEIGKTLKRLIDKKKLKPPKYTIRFLLSWELYGFGHYFATNKNKLKSIISTTNLDSCAMDQSLANEPLSIMLSPDWLPTFTDIPFEKIATYYFSRIARNYRTLLTQTTGGDDTFMSDPTIGIPTNWLYQKEGKYWHCSLGSLEKVDSKLLNHIISIVAIYAYFIASAGAKETLWMGEQIVQKARKSLLNKISEIKRGILLDNKSINWSQIIAKLKFQKNLEFSRIRSLTKPRGIEQNSIEHLGDNITAFYNKAGKNLKEYIKKKNLYTARASGRLLREEKTANNMILTRKGIGLPFCLAKVPFNQRMDLHVPCAALRWADGKRSLLDIARCIEFSSNRSLAKDELKSIIRSCQQLSKYGYLNIKYKVTIHKNDIINTLHEIGVKKGSLIFMHSSLSDMGHVPGGADTIINALLETIGPKGTLIMPAFASSSRIQSPVIHDGLNKEPHIAFPYDPNKSSSGDGKISDVFWRRKGVLRSRQPTHSIAAYGYLAEYMVEGHDETKSPNYMGGPWSKILQNDGVFLFWGVDFNCMTFLHAMEDWLNMPYVTTAKAAIIKNRKVVEVEVIKYVPGHRDFYKGGAAKIFKELHKEKLKIKSKRIGLGEIKLIKAKELYNRTYEIMKRKPDILLCDNPDCKFCADGKEKIKKGLKYVCDRHK